MRIQDIPDQQILGAALVVLGLSLGGAAAIAGLLAVDHMALTQMCGPTFGHCIRCVAAAALLVAAVGVSGAGAWLMKARQVLSPAT